MRYFLHIRSHDGVVRDLEGAEYSDLEAARQDAIKSARELLSEMLRRGEVVNGRTIEICDEEGRVRDTVSLREQIRLS